MWKHHLLRMQGEKYGYTEKLTSLDLPAGCSADQVRISRLYVQVHLHF